MITLRSPNYRAVKTTISGAAVSAGDYVNLNDVYGFYLVDGEIGDEVIVIVQADLVEVDKEASLAINEGDAVYYDTSADEVDKTNTNVLVGFAEEPALAADAKVFISWDGNAAFLKA